MGIKEIGRGIEGAQELAVFLPQNGFELIHIAHKQELLAAERFAHITRIYAQHLVHEVDYVRTHHAYLVDDDKLHLTENLALLAVVLQGILDVAV